MHTRTAVAAVAAAALLAGGAAAVPALGGTSHSASTPPPWVLISKVVASGGNSNSSRPGSTFWRSENLRLWPSGNRVIGTSYLACTVFTSTISECTETWDFGSAGLLQGAGDSIAINLGNATQLAVTGGTGSFADEQGTASVNLLSTAGETGYTFNLTGQIPSTLLR